MKIALSGAAGRMGKRILTLAHGHPDISITGALEFPGHPSIGRDAGDVAGVGSLGVAISSDVSQVLQGCDVLIDFTTPEASLHHVQEAARLDRAIVVGTTGLSEEQRAELQKVGQGARCVFAPNMSMGVNLLFKLVEQVAKSLGSEYDVEIVEAHHRMKKDAPSGTAARLGEIIARALDRNIADSGVYGRQGMVGERSRSEIGVMALRGGDIVGEHTVMFVTNGERLELTHRAHSRNAFAQGALQAALWVVERPKGVYDMQDVLGLREYE